MTPTSRPIPDVLLERYLADDLGAEARARIDAELATSPALRDRLAALQSSRDAFLAADPPARFAHRVAVKAAVTSRRPGRRLWWALAPAGAAAAGVLVVVVGLRQPDGAPTTRAEWGEQHEKVVAPSVTPPAEGPSAPAAAAAPRDSAPPAPARAAGHEAVRRAPAPLPAADGSRSLEAQGIASNAAPAPKGGSGAPPSPLRAFEPAARARPSAKKEASARAEARDEAAPTEAKSKSAASEDVAADKARAPAAPPAQPTLAPPTFAPPAPVPPPRPLASAESPSRGAVDEPAAASLAQAAGAGRAVDAAGPGEREAAPETDGITTLSVRGPVTPAQVTAVLRTNRARVQTLWASVDGATSIRLVLDVDEKGAVTAVRVTEPQGEQVAARVRALVRHWRFPAAPGRGASTITLGLRPR